MKTILITGGSGFIGTNLIESLDPNKLRIVNLDKKPPINKAHASYWHEANIMNIEQVLYAFNRFKPDIVIHLAARTDTLSDILIDYDENIKGNENIINAVKASNYIERLIITSTQYVYKSDLKPLPSYDDEYKPHTTYGQSKVLTEQYTRKANLNCIWTIIRPTNIWGPWHMRYPIELLRLIDKGFYFHPVKHPVIRTYGYVKNIVFQLNNIVNSPSDLVNRKTFYLGDSPIDSYIWLNEISLQLRKKSIRCLPKLIFSCVSLFGDLLRSIHIPFPIYSKRFSNMIEDYAAPTEETIKLFGVAQLDLHENVNETITWLKTEGAHYFDYWRSKSNSN